MRRHCRVRSCSSQIFVLFEERERECMCACVCVFLYESCGPRSRRGMGEVDGLVHHAGPRIYSCCNCRCHVSDHDDIISKCFQVLLLLFLRLFALVVDSCFYLLGGKIKSCVCGRGVVVRVRACACLFVCLSLILRMLWDGFGSLLNFGFGGARWTTRSFVMDFCARLLVRVRNFLPGPREEEEARSNN